MSIGGLEQFPLSEYYLELLDSSGNCIQPQALLPWEITERKKTSSVAWHCIFIFKCTLPGFLLQALRLTPQPSEQAEPSCFCYSCECALHDLLNAAGKLRNLLRMTKRQALCGLVCSASLFIGREQPGISRPWKRTETNGSACEQSDMRAGADKVEKAVWRWCFDSMHSSRELSRKLALRSAGVVVYKLLPR